MKLLSGPVSWLVATFFKFDVSITKCTKNLHDTAILLATCINLLIIQLNIVHCQVFPIYNTNIVTLL